MWQNIKAALKSLIKLTKLCCSFHPSRLSAGQPSCSATELPHDIFAASQHSIRSITEEHNRWRNEFGFIIVHLYNQLYTHTHTCTHTDAQTISPLCTCMQMSNFWVFQPSSLDYSFTPSVSIQYIASNQV